MTRIPILLFAALAAHAAHAGPLAAALEAAWARHPEASATAAREEEVRARAELAAALTPAPAAVSLAAVNDELAGNNRGKREWEVELSLPLWLPGQKSARGAEAEAALAELASRRQAVRLRLAGELREAWWTLAGARAGLEQARRGADGLRALADDVARRHRAGELARVDANLARGELTRAEAEVLAAEASLARAEQAWRVLTGLPAPGRLDAEALPPAGRDAESIAREHPELAARTSTVRLARAHLQVARESRREAPELAFSLIRERDDGDSSYENTAGLRLTIPFSGDARARREDAAARSELAQADAELARARALLELDVERARRELDLAERQLALAGERAPLFAENLKLAEKAFTLGETDLASLLRVRALAIADAAEGERLRVARDAAVSRLLQALGVAP
ncbi:MAG: TolC family protein [Thiobacillaceae bacterium]|jgi:outer membrane protein TolC|nr:TolC family protein [Thiobacillaceae bacterium]